MSKSTKYIAVILIALALAGGAVWAAFRPPAIECMVLERTSLDSAFSEIGEVVPLSEYEIYTMDGGKLLAVYGEEGAPVRKGERLFLFDDSGLRDEEDRIAAEIAVVESQIREQITALESQKHALASERAGLQIQWEQALIEEELLLWEVESHQALFDAGGISVQELNGIQSEYALSLKKKELIASQLAYAQDQIPVVDARIRRLVQGQTTTGDTAQAGTDGDQPLSAQKALLETRLRILQKSRSETEIFAAGDGIIRDLSVRADQVVAPGTKLCSVYQPGGYSVECYILVEDAQGVFTGDEAMVTVRQRDVDRRFPGVVSMVGRAATDVVSKAGLTEKRIKTEIRVDGEGWESVGPQWPVEVRFTDARADDCLVAPKTALFESASGDWMVWVVRNGAPGAVAVAKGVETPSQSEIRGDISPGDVIVVNAKKSNVREGRQIRATFGGGGYGN